MSFPVTLQPKCLVTSLHYLKKTKCFLTVALPKDAMIQRHLISKWINLNRFFFVVVDVIFRFIGTLILNVMPAARLKKLETAECTIFFWLRFPDSAIKKCGAAIGESPVQKLSTVPMQMICGVMSHFRPRPRPPVCRNINVTFTFRERCPVRSLWTPKSPFPWPTCHIIKSTSVTLPSLYPSCWAISGQICCCTPCAFCRLVPDAVRPNWWGLFHFLTGTSAGAKDSDRHIFLQVEIFHS